MGQKKQLSYYQDVAENLSPEEIAHLKPETQEYLHSQDKSIGEVLNKEDSAAAKRRIVERMRREGTLETNVSIDMDDIEDEQNLATDTPVTLDEVSARMYLEYEKAGRTDLEIELDPLIIEEKSSVKKLHVLVSTTEADHQKFLHSLNKKIISE